SLLSPNNAKLWNNVLRNWKEQNMTNTSSQSPQRQLSSLTQSCWKPTPPSESPIFIRRNSQRTMMFSNGMTSTTPRMWITKHHRSWNTQRRSHCQPQPRNTTMTSAAFRAQWQDLRVSSTPLPTKSCHQATQTVTWGSAPSTSSTPSASLLRMTSRRSVLCERRSIMMPSASSMATKRTTRYSRSKNSPPLRRLQNRSRRSTRSRSTGRTSPRRTNTTMQEQATNPSLSNKTSPSTKTRVTSQMAGTSLTAASLLVNRNPSDSRRNNQPRETTKRSRT
ncbi:hypothetical protein BGZ92_005758, partial [Podila epicladia]